MLERGSAAEPCRGGGLAVVPCEVDAGPGAVPEVGRSVAFGFVSRDGDVRRSVIAARHEEVGEGIGTGGQFLSDQPGVARSQPADVVGDRGRLVGLAQPLDDAGPVSSGSTRAFVLVSALGGTRTPNLLIRSQMLYPLSYERLCRDRSVVLGSNCGTVVRVTSNWSTPRDDCAARPGGRRRQQPRSDGSSPSWSGGCSRSS